MRRLFVALLAPATLFAARSVRAECELPPPPPVVISAPRAEVWAALTTAKGIVATEGGRAIVDLRPGGSIRRHVDPNATPEAAGWTSRAVLAYVSPRLLLLGDDTPTTWTALELDALDGLRTRLRIEHVGVAANSKAAGAAEASDRAFVARLERVLPQKPDPVVAAFTALVGAWEERRLGRTGAELDVLRRWTVAIDPGDVELGLQPSVVLEGTSPKGGRLERWVFWREAESARWIGALVVGGELAAYEVTPHASGAIGWFCRWAMPGPEELSIGPAARDGSVRVWRTYGCCGEGFDWTRAAVAK